MPRKKQNQEISFKGDPSLIDWANGFTFWTLNAKMVGRLSHKAKERCSDCGTPRGKLHIIPCKLEESPCGIHETCWECTCEYYKEE